MKHFTIENDTNNITIHASAKDAEALPNSEPFSNEATLAKLAVDWPTARLVEIWNGLPGVTPVTKFKDRSTSVSRIWKQIQNLTEAEPIAEAVSEVEATPAETQTSTDVPAETAPVANATDPQPEPEIPATATTVAPQLPDVAPEAAAAPVKATREKKAPQPAADGQSREGSKTSQVVAMLKREGGTTLEEIMTAIGWQKHTTRAMLSAGGSLTKNHGLVIVSEKVGDKRVYSINA